MTAKNLVIPKLSANWPGQIGPLITEVKKILFNQTRRFLGNQKTM